MSRRFLLFPGQGAQFVGMGADLIEKVPSARRIFEKAGAILGFDMAAVCTRGPQEELSRTAISQPAILTTSYAALDTLGKYADLSPASVVGAAGLSLGEYTALVFAGALTFEDALRIVKARGRLMAEASRQHPGTMSSIMGLEEDVFAEVVDEVGADHIVTMANFNCPGQIVVSGSIEGVETVERLAEARGAARITRLRVSGAFHSPLMEPARAGLKNVLDEVDIRKTTVSVYSNVTAMPMDGPAEIRRLLVAQLVSPVRWQQTMTAVLGEGVSEYYEIGPGRVLSGLMRRIDRKAVVENVMTLESISKVRSEVSDA